MNILDHYEEFLAKLSEAERKNYFNKLSFDYKNSSAKNYIFIAPNPLIAKFIATKYSKKLADFLEANTNNRPKISIQAKTGKNKFELKPSLNKSRQAKLILNPEFTFDNFIVGECNTHTYSIMKAACEDLGGRYNPVFIYGSTGLGKTHLLQAFGHQSLKMGKKVMYATVEDFINDYAFHMRNNSFEKLKEKYRSPDALLIDDIQLLGNTDTIKEEFFHTFNEVRAHGGQIVLASDVAPNLLKGIEERLKSRFANGIITDITPPRLDTKIAIIKSKCEINDIVLGNDIIRFIASKMGDNIREIEGIIVNLCAHARISNIPMSMDLVVSTMKDHIKEKRERITLEDILESISLYYNVRSCEVCSNKKTKAIVQARRVAIYLAAVFTNLTYTQLARCFNLKGHTAISHSKKTLEELLKNDPLLKSSVDELKEKLTNKRRPL